MDNVVSSRIILNSHRQSISPQPPVLFAFFICPIKLYSSFQNKSASAFNLASLSTPSSSFELSDIALYLQSYKGRGPTLQFSESCIYLHSDLPIISHGFDFKDFSPAFFILTSFISFPEKQVFPV